MVPSKKKVVNTPMNQLIQITPSSLQQYMFKFTMCFTRFLMKLYKFTNGENGQPLNEQGLVVIDK